MNSVALPVVSIPSLASPRKLSCDLVALASGLLPPFDVASVVLAGYVSTWLYGTWITSNGFGFANWSGHECVAVAAAAVLTAITLYDKHFGKRASRGDAGALLRRYLGGLLLFTAACLAVAFANRSPGNLPPAWLALWLGSGLVLTALSRLLLALKLRQWQRRGRLNEVIAVVGAGPIADRLVRHLRHTSDGRVQILGIFDDAHVSGTPNATGIKGTVGDLLEIGKLQTIDWILLALPCTAEAPLLANVSRLKALAVPIALCPENVGLALPISAIDYLSDGLPVTLLADRPIRRWNAVVKSLEDAVLSTLITVMLLPLLAIVAIAIRLDSKGPVIFRQRRHTFNNREFDVYKFRTMRSGPAAAGDALTQTVRGDQRITRIGRLLRASSLDELPQLFNVLQGDMSLVGPRPHAVNMRTEDRLGGEITASYAHRHRVKPGMTGWSQVNGCRGATDTTEQLRRRIELDIRYVENWSLWLDLKILALTVPEVLKRTNAF